MNGDLDERLRKALDEREKLSSLAQKIQGRKEAAAKSLEELRREILAKNLDPDSLDETINNLERAYLEAVTNLEREISSAREAISPYLENSK